MNLIIIYTKSTIFFLFTFVWFFYYKIFSFFVSFCFVFMSKYTLLLMSANTTVFIGFSQLFGNLIDYLWFENGAVCQAWIMYWIYTLQETEVYLGTREQTNQSSMAENPENSAENIGQPAEILESTDGIEKSATATKINIADAVIRNKYGRYTQ